MSLFAPIQSLSNLYVKPWNNFPFNWETINLQHRVRTRRSNDVLASRGNAVIYEPRVRNHVVYRFPSIGLGLRSGSHDRVRFRPLVFRVHRGLTFPSTMHQFCLHFRFVYGQTRIRLRSFHKKRVPFHSVPFWTFT